MIAITIKKEDLKKISNDLNIYIYKNEIESNASLDAQKMVDLTKDNGWRVAGFKKVPLILF